MCLKHLRLHRIIMFGIQNTFMSAHLWSWRSTPNKPRKGDREGEARVRQKEQKPQVIQHEPQEIDAVSSGNSVLTLLGRGAELNWGKEGRNFRGPEPPTAQVRTQAAAALMGTTRALGASRARRHQFKPNSRLASGHSRTGNTLQ